MAGKAAGRRSVMRRRAAKKEKAALKGGQSNVTAKTDIPTPAITEVTLARFRHEQKVGTDGPTFKG